MNNKNFDSCAPPSLQINSSIVKRIAIDHVIPKQSENDQHFIPWQKELFNILKNSPGMINWKNNASEFLGCSPKVAQIIGLERPEDIIGKNDYDMPWGLDEYVDLFRTEDKEAMNGKILYILGRYKFNYYDLTVLVKKIPVQKDSGQIVGTINFISDFKPNIRDILSNFLDLGINITLELLNDIKNTFLNSNINLSRREEECAYFLFKGLTAKEIAKQLNISNRTVEFYLNSMKEKFNCKKTSSLIVKMLEMGYLDNVPTPMLLDQILKEAI